MHYRGFVFVDQPTDDALQAAMAPHIDEHWDWYRPGGRWDGYLVSDVEMKARETDNGFNFSGANKRIDRNFCLVSEVPEDRRQIAFFVLDGHWIDREPWNGSTFVTDEEYEAKLARAMGENQSRFVVVVDAHN